MSFLLKDFWFALTKNSLANTLVNTFLQHISAAIPIGWILRSAIDWLRSTHILKCVWYNQIVFQLVL